MKYRVLSAILAAVMTFFIGTAVCSAEENGVLSAGTAVQAPLAQVSVTVPYSCPFVYSSMLFEKLDYPEGMGWTNDDFYAWNGGYYSGGYGCVAFAFILSDAAFLYESCTLTETLNISNIRTGDILRQNGHSFIVLEVRSDRVVIAEGNYNESIHWGREVTFDELADGFEHHITRYPATGFKFVCDTVECASGQTYISPMISRDDPNATWTSSDPSVATVDSDGKVTVLSAGTITITATNGTTTDSYKLVADGGVKEEPTTEKPTTEAPTEPTTEAPTEPPVLEDKLGDVTEDNRVNALDAASVLVAAASIGAGNGSGLTAQQELNADVNFDNEINAQDAAAILRYAAFAGTGNTQTLREFLG